MRRIAAACLLLLAALPFPAPAGEPPVRLATASWPPYLDDGLPGQGTLAEVLRRAFAESGRPLELAFFPWARTLQTVRDPATAFDGYAVDYWSPEVEQEFLLSDIVFHSPLGIAERAAAPVAWSTLADLQRYRFALVSGYVNTDAFDRLVAAGQVLAEYESEDVLNLRKLQAGRVDAAVIDARVMQWLVANDPLLRAHPGVLRMNPRVLERKALYVAFRRNARGEALRAAFNAGLRRVDVERLLAVPPAPVAPAAPRECCRNP